MYFLPRWHYSTRHAIKVCYRINHAKVNWLDKASVKVSKKSKKQNNNNGEFNVMNQQCPVPVPNVVNMDEIAIYSDEELFARMTSLENDRNKVIEARFDPMLWEIEIAYLRREAGIRRQRREAHEIFLRDNAHLLPEEDVNFEFDAVSAVNA